MKNDLEVIVNNHKFFHELVGLVTKTDIIDSYFSGLPIETKVSQIMNHELIYINENEDLDQAATLFNDNKIHHLIVTDESEHVIGLLSTFDILKSFVPESKKIYLKLDNLFSVLEQIFKRGNNFSEFKKDQNYFNENYFLKCEPVLHKKYLKDGFENL
jgi:signal-transduction protein with cAMP-binding, CBS, and nucleotidyltransferase domain